jgi:hypothetical protein
MEIREIRNFYTRDSLNATQRRHYICLKNYIIVNKNRSLCTDLGLVPDHAAKARPTRLVKRANPSVPPMLSSIRFSGCGIRPRIFSFSE